MAGFRSLGERVLPALRSPAGQRVLRLLLIASIGLLIWWFVDRLPDEGTVEIRWTEATPLSVGLSYTDADGNIVRYRREAMSPGADRLRDVYELPAGRYLLRIEVRRANGVRVVQQHVHLPTPDPHVIYLEELPELEP